jgi:hypothetical protein
MMQNPHLAKQIGVKSPVRESMSGGLIKCIYIYSTISSGWPVGVTPGTACRVNRVSSNDRLRENTAVILHARHTLNGVEGGNDATWVDAYTVYAFYRLLDCILGDSIFGIKPATFRIESVKIANWTPLSGATFVLKGLGFRV